MAPPRTLLEIEYYEAEVLVPANNQCRRALTKPLTLFSQGSLRGNNGALPLRYSLIVLALPRLEYPVQR